MIVRVPTNQFTKQIEKKTYCDHVCEAVPLICTNFKMKMSDHLLLGGEHTMKVSPGFH